MPASRSLGVAQTPKAGAPKRGEIITIASGKGGVGKTNLALNVGIHLARRGVRTILVDADFGLANTDVLLNVTPLGDIADLIDSRRPIEELLVRGPEGLQVLCGVSGPLLGGAGRTFDPLRCVQALERLERMCDVLLIDCGAGVSRLVAAMALAGDRLVLCTTPEPTALTDAYATLKLLVREGFTGPVGVAVNMARRREAAAAFHRLQRASKQFLGLNVHWLGYVPRDRRVADAVRSRAPVVVRYPRCAASTCLEYVSLALMPPGRQQTLAGGMWSRVASLFL